jgi:hypothetical protein
MLAPLAIFVVGLAALIVGGTVRAHSLARRLGLLPLVIRLTVFAIRTSRAQPDSGAARPPATRAAVAASLGFELPLLSRTMMLVVIPIACSC